MAATRLVRATRRCVMRISVGSWLVFAVAVGWLASGCASAGDSGGRGGSGGQGSGSGGSGSAAQGSNNGTTVTYMGGSSAGGSGSSSAQAGSGSGATGAAGSGSGESGSSGGGSSAAVDCSALPLPANSDDVISTFEDGTGSVSQVAGRGGGFYMFNDGTGTQMPPPGALPDATKVDRCDSMFALCMSGSGFTMWGAGMGTDLGPTSGGGDGGTGTKSPYDASMYKGISFWAKANAGSTGAIRVSLKDKNTAPEGGVCDDSVSSGATACNDDWGKALTLTMDWKPYTIMFADMRQSGWGAAYSAFDVKNVYSLQFQVNQGLDFDLCIDDLAFVR